ncbi:hypothetical protein JTE90_017298, partial [Oedothorax gibbosus]
GSAGGSQCLLVWPASLTSQLLCEWSAPCRAAPSRKLFLWEYGAYCDRSIGLRVGVVECRARGQLYRLSSFLPVVSSPRCNMQRGTW